MEKVVTLKDGGRVLIRDMREDDVQMSFEFFGDLSAEDRKYLRYDVTQWEVVARRVEEIGSGRVERLVVLDDHRIVADGALELAGHGWGDNIAEIRLIVAGDYQRRGLGLLLARELYFLAADHKAHRIVARMMAPQVGARQIMAKLGFQDEFLIPGHVRDREGNWQDLIIMRCNLEDLWADVEGTFASADFQRHR